MTSPGRCRRIAQGAVPLERLRSLTDSTYDLYQDFETVMTTGTDEDKAAIALMCYLYDVLPAQ